MIINDYITHTDVNKLSFICNNYKASIGLTSDGQISISYLTQQSPFIDNFTIFIYSDK